MKIIYLHLIAFLLCIILRPVNFPSNKVKAMKEFFQMRPLNICGICSISAQAPHADIFWLLSYPSNQNMQASFLLNFIYCENNNMQNKFLMAQYKFIGRSQVHKLKSSTHNLSKL